MHVVEFESHPQIAKAEPQAKRSLEPYEPYAVAPENCIETFARHPEMLAEKAQRFLGILGLARDGFARRRIEERAELPARANAAGSGDDWVLSGELRIHGVGHPCGVLFGAGASRPGMGCILVRPWKQAAMYARYFVLAFVALAASLGIPAHAAGGLTLDRVFGKEPPLGRPFGRVSWAPNGREFLYVKPGQDPDEALTLMLFDAASGASREWATPARFGAKHTPAVAAWSPDSTRVAILADGTLYVAHAADAQAEKIAEDVDDVRWSPSGDALAYAHNADLYVAKLVEGAAVQRKRVTTGGIPDSLMNGALDWVYPEELGIEHGFAWSSDGAHIAYLHIDERAVTNFPIVDFLPNDNRVNFQRYPLAGERNPGVSMRVLDLGTGADRLVYDASPHDEYVAAFDWIPHSLNLQAEIVDRHQRSLRVDIWAAAQGAPSTAYAQTSKAWVDVIPLPAWLADGRSVWLLDRDTTIGAYLRAADGTLQKLSGTYRAFALAGVDEKTGTAYVTAGYPTRRDRSLLALSPAGTMRNLTPALGVHTVALAPTFDRFVDRHDTLNDLPQTDLVATDSLAATVLEPQEKALRADLLPTELLEVPSQYGPLDAIMIKPPNFDPSKKYPVVVYVYGGPGAPTTTNGNENQNSLYSQLLAQSGFVVFSIDGPGSQVDNDDHVRLLYHNFGPGSLLGQEIGAKYLATLPYVDAARIGIWGWSFGGYETCYALTHSSLFKAGAAVAPVTDWHLYDSIYTERYMGQPQEDLASYDASSVLDAAGRLNGPLLIQHGTADNNVHMSNSIQLLEAFIRADEPRVSFYPYPRKVHSIAGLNQHHTLFARMLNFWKANL
jgi:dipeptidyl-peptidase 4